MLKTPTDSLQSSTSKPAAQKHMIGIKLTIYAWPLPLLLLSLPSLRHVTADTFSLPGLRGVEAKRKRKKKPKKNLQTQNKPAALLPLGAAK